MILRGHKHPLLTSPEGGGIWFPSLREGLGEGAEQCVKFDNTPQNHIVVVLATNHLRFMRVRSIQSNIKRPKRT